MVENSLGRLWVEGHPNESLKSEWKYYLEEAKQELDVKVELKKIKNEYSKFNPEDIKIIDIIMQRLIQFNYPSGCYVWGCANLKRVLKDKVGDFPAIFMSKSIKDVKLVKKYYPRLLL